jgi:hypothetical protein
MSPRYGVRIGAMMVLTMVTLAALGATAPAGAQLYEDARRALGLTPDPIARSPRLLGMGRLSLTVDDPRNQIALWDFAGNPVGILDDDTTSTLELMPTTAASSSLSDLDNPGRLRERQHFASRNVTLDYEAWHRTARSSSYGLAGSVALLRTDQPVDLQTERRSNFTIPSIMGVANGHLPYLLTDRMQYALRAFYSYETREDGFRRIVSNASGEYIDVDGDILPSPDFFTPDRWSGRSIGAGGDLSFRFGEPLTVAGGYNMVGELVRGENEGGRYASETRENRPYGTWQGSAVGSLGKTLQYGVDARRWTADSKASFVFSLSSGPASAPLAGRGSLYRREEEGSSLRGRVRFLLGAFEVGGGFGAFRREARIFAPGPEDSTSFNAFRNATYFIPSADTLYLPDSVANDANEEKAWDAGGGIGWRSSDRRLYAGAEFHRLQDRFEGVLAGEGPKRASWDVRTGLEYALGAALRVRGGYIHRWLDGDELTESNEYLANAVTTGFGLSPVGATWTVETGFLYEWERADFGDPGRPRSTRQQLAVRVFWPL